MLKANSRENYVYANKVKENLNGFSVMAQNRLETTFKQQKFNFPILLICI